MVLIRSLLAASAAVQLFQPTLAAPAPGNIDVRDVGDFFSGIFGGGDNNKGDEPQASGSGDSDNSGNFLGDLFDKGKDALEDGVEAIKDGVGDLLGTGGSGGAGVLPNSSTTSGSRDRSGPVLITGGWEPITSGEIPARPEIREMMRDKESFSLYLLALRKIQDDPDITNPLSYFQLSCIHGEPKMQVWNNDKPKAEVVGYCKHNSNEFPTWHRPYLLAYEQALYEAIQEIVENWPKDSPYKSAMEKKCKQWRMPYWDSSLKGVDPIMPKEISHMESISCITPDGEKEIDNPLYTFRFPKGAEEYLGSKVMSWFPQNQIVRDYPDIINTALRSQRATLQSEISKLFTNKDQSWDAFATKTSRASGSNIDQDAFGRGNWANTFSVEFVHDQVHGYVGTNGNTMASPAVAGFDPIFWLHHCNVDRIFAEWQKFTNYKTYVPRELTNKPLIPFRKGDGEYYTNKDVESIFDLGYTYSSVGSPNKGKTEDGDDGKDIEIIRQNYPGWLDAVMGANGGDDDDDEKDQSSNKDKDLDIPSRFSKGDLKPYIGKIVKDNKYYEYSAAIEIDTSKFEKPVDIYAYLGDGDDSTKHDITNAYYDPEFVGKYSTFSWVMGGQEGGIIRAGIPLTGALLKKISKKKLGSMLESNTVQSYLEKHFEYVVIDNEGNEVDDNDGCSIDIVHSEVTLPGKKTEMPTFKQPKKVYKPKPAPKEKFVYHAPPAPKKYSAAPAPAPPAETTTPESPSTPTDSASSPDAPAGTQPASGDSYAPPAANPSGSPSETPLPAANSGLSSFVPSFKSGIHIIITLAISSILFM